MEILKQYRRNSKVLISSTINTPYFDTKGLTLVLGDKFNMNTNTYLIQFNYAELDRIIGLHKDQLGVVVQPEYQTKPEVYVQPQRSLASRFKGMIGL